MRRQAIPLVIIAMVAVACGSGGSGTPSATEPPTTAPSTTTTQGTAPAGVVTVADSAFGEILADGDGATLYVFEPDARGDSTCYDGCATAWPPFTGDVAAGDGVDASLLGETTRTDGSVQVTYGGWPLYYYSGDGSPGDVNGQGVNGVWYVVSPAGDEVRSDAAGAGAGPGGY